MSVDYEAQDEVQMPTGRDPESFCRCGHYEDEHDTGGVCRAVLPDRCSCNDFRLGARSRNRRGWRG